jgi:hypothetical protein
MSTPGLELPADLVEFLSAGRQLEYDPADCDAGAVTLVSLGELTLQRFPVETSGSEHFEEDPHYPDVKSYLVLGVNLIASCTGDYEAAGLLLWLPIEKRFGIWDSSHCNISLFGPDVTWTQIVAAPADHINAGWGTWGVSYGGQPVMTELIPWPAHPYGTAQVYEPQPA